MRVPLGDPNVVCGTNTKGEVCLSGGACTALSGPLGGHLALTAQEHEALSMLRMACSMHLSQRALLRMPRRCTQRDLRTVRQRIMPYVPIVKSTTGRNRAAAHVPLQSIVQNAISMARVIGKPPPSGVAIVVISVDATSLWKASSTRADVWVNVWGGGKICFKGEAMGLMVLHGWRGCIKGWSLVRPSVSLRHMHHCMSMNALEQGLLGLEAAKASDIDDFV